MGTGKIGIELIKLLRGFEGRVLAYDVYPCPEAVALGAEYVGLDELLREADVVSLHVPLLPSTRHIINREVRRRRVCREGGGDIPVGQGGPRICVAVHASPPPPPPRTHTQTHPPTRVLHVCALLQKLLLMKRDAILINVSRGALIDTQALLEVGIPRV